MTDPEAYQEYARQAAPTIAKFGGRVIARDANAVVLDGDWNPQRIVVIEFENAEQAKAWYESAEYKGPKSIKKSASRVRTILVAGV
ncbi:MAG: DUF1330 domain-containing protein [Bradyrhizobiaceae bacterium]|nr:DUF1330 domain-containing protein [Bradyrhizobiaceae bacterium]